MVSTSAAGRWQQEIPYTNGCFQLYFGWWVYLVRRRITEFHGIGEIDWDEVLRRLPLNAIRDFINPAGHTWQNMVERNTLDDFWRSFRFDERYDQIDVPCLHVSGWYDLEDLLGAFHHYEHMIDGVARQRTGSDCWSDRGATSSRDSRTRATPTSSWGPPPRWTWTRSTCAGSTTG